MKNWYNTLFNSKKPIVSGKDFNTVEFIIDNDGTPHIKVSIGNTDDEAAKALGDLIHSLSVGLYNNSMLDVLHNMSHKDNEIHTFVNKVLIHYNLYQTNFILNNTIASKNSVSQPLIKPTEFVKKTL
jgi:hypothetical protein